MEMINLTAPEYGIDSGWSISTLLEPVEDLFGKFADHIQQRGVRRERKESITSWSQVQNPYDVTGETSVADIPWIQDEGWYQSGERSGNGGIFQHLLAELKHYYSFAIPSQLALEFMKDYSPICEMGAGSGYWAKLLADRGVDIIAYDTVLPNKEDFHKVQKLLAFNKEVAMLQMDPCDLRRDIPEEEYEQMEELRLEMKGKRPWAYQLFFPVQKCSKDFIPPSDRALFMCWPLCNDPMGNDILNRYKGDTFIYIGESWGGCTGDNDFFETLDREWEEIEEVYIPQHYGMNDYLSVYKRKGTCH